MPSSILFVHNNFPAQYRHLVAELAARPVEYRLFAFGSPTARAMPGVELLKYKLDPGGMSADVGHPFARRFQAECMRAEQVMYLASALRAEGVDPDIIFVHPGWGEALPLRAIFPQAKIVVFCEFYYRSQGSDVGFDAEFPQFGLDGLVRVHMRNAATLLALADADYGVSPTEWQRQQYPAAFQPRISVIHDGIDVDTARPDPTARLQLPNGTTLKPGDKVVTYVARNLEPYRGIHIFLRTLPQVLATHPDAQVVLVGGDGVSYGSRSEDGRSWQSIFLEEVRGRLDLSRVHFLGQVPRATFLKVLQVSAAHVYLTYPFVLSWSMLEAMSAGCLVIGSDTQPVREVLRDGRTGLMVPFFSTDLLADQINAALARPDRYRDIRRAARDHIVANYSVADCVRLQMQLIHHLLGERAAAGAAYGATNTRLASGPRQR